MASSGKFSNLGSFLEQPLTTHLRKERSIVTPSGITQGWRSARDNPILQEAGYRSPHPMRSLVCWNPLLKRSIPNLSMEVHHFGRPGTVRVIEAQQESLNSLVSIVLQNPRAADILTAEVGGTCALNKEICSMWISTSSQVEANLNIIKKNTKLSHHLEARAGQGPFGSCHSYLSSRIPCGQGFYPFCPPSLCLCYYYLLDLDF